ncbi:MAG: pyridoxamine 5'-phosphate oxidase family protein [Actinomycetota bacterium]|nr:pyridoxamine 5'-phosphate oxidase family protein [Actinomycetota bacterium]
MTSGELPEWRDGAVAILSTVSGGMPHGVPVSTAVRAGPRRVLFALAHSRGSLARLCADPRAALSLVGAGDIAFTARGRAAVVVESLEGADNVAAVALDVERIDDHGRAEFEILDGVRWRWLDESAQRRDAQVRAALRALVSEPRTR